MTFIPTNREDSSFFYIPSWAFIVVDFLLLIYSSEHLLCASGPSLCLLCRNVHLNLVPLLDWVFLWLGFSLMLRCISCLCVLEINSLWVSLFANVSSCSEGCACLSFRVSFGRQMVLSLMRSHFLICGLFFIILRGRCTKTCCVLCQIMSCLYFSQEFRSIHHYL